MDRNSVKVAALLGALAMTGVGCRNMKEASVGSAEVSVHALQISDISSMRVTVTGAALTSPLVVPLVQRGNQFMALVTNIPVGTDYTFTASGRDNATPPAELFHGAVANQTIQKGRIANIVINMNQVAPGQAYSNAAPVIDSITASSLSVAGGDLVNISATARDPNTGDTAQLVFTWAVTCGQVGSTSTVPGTDTTGSVSTTVFTAPATDSSCAVNLTVRDPKLLASVASFNITVGAGGGKGGAKITTLPNVYPVISGMTANPAQLAPGVTTTLTVAATDPDGDSLTYAWTSPCAGTFGSANAATTTFALPAASTATSCDFQVVVTDGTFPNGEAKGVITNHLTLAVKAVGVLAPPQFGLAYQSHDTINDGNIVNMAMVATDPAGGTLTYAWSASSGSAPVVVTPASMGLDPTVFATAANWTAPAGAGSGSPVTITVTATSSVSPNLAATTTLTLVPANSFCAGQADGTACSIPGNLCVLSATCQAGACVAASSVSCPASTVACQTNACVPSTGVCTLSAALDNTACSDGNSCTGEGNTDVCSAGACVGAAKVCPAPTGPNAACQSATCAPASGVCGFANAANGTVCSDANLCTTSDVCTAGICGGTAVTCGVGFECSLATGACVPSTPLACMVPSYSKMSGPVFKHMAAAPDGTLYMTGNIFNPFDFGSGPIASSGSSDVYLAKINPATGVATAAWSYGEVGGLDQSATAVGVAAGGQVAILGNLQGEIDLSPLADSGTLGVDYVTNTTPIDFYAVFATDGTPIRGHAINLGTSNTGSMLSLGSNPTQGAFVVCGKTDKASVTYAAALTNKGIVTTAAVAGGGMDIVVAKIDAATGNVLWGRQIGGAGNQQCNRVSLDNNGDVILTGTYHGTLDFGGATAALPVVADTAAAVLYVAKLSGTTGAGMSAAAWGTTGRQNPMGITADANNNILIAGALGASIDFGGGISIANAGLTDAFVVKFTGTLGPVWAKSYGDSVYNQQAYSVATDSTGNAFVSGLFTGSMGGLNINSIGLTNSDAFIAELSAADGSTLCAQVYGDAPGAQEAAVITVARTATGALANSVAFAGLYSSSITFGTLPPLVSPGPGIALSYLARVVP